MDYRTLIGEILSGAIRRYKEREQSRRAAADLPSQVANGNGNGNGGGLHAVDLGGSEMREGKG
jgi:hypothetical protein